MSLRSRVLHRAFAALYGPLVFLHEPAGRCLFGPSWCARREALGSEVEGCGPLLDLGCGGGQLLSVVDAPDRMTVGVDSSSPMLRGAARRGHRVVLADARMLPLLDASIVSVLCTYPGPWIKDSMVWEELNRVTMPGATVSLLLGGTVFRGRFSRIRSLVITVLYGCQDFPAAESEMQDFGQPYFRGQLNAVEDDWGRAFIWKGVRLSD